jgi:hypothetical protein
MSKTTLQVLPAFTEAECSAGVLKYAGKSAWACIGMGLFFLKGHSLHRRAEGRQKRNCPDSGQLTLADAAAPNEGFKLWLERTFQETPFGVSKTTAFCYMNAARKLGLTVESTEADLEALQARDALAGRRLSALYRLSGGELEPGQEPAASPKEKPGQMWFDFYDQMDGYFEDEGDALKQLTQLPLESLKNMQARMEKGLGHVKEAVAAASAAAARDKRTTAIQ